MHSRTWTRISAATIVALALDVTACRPSAATPAPSGRAATSSISWTSRPVAAAPLTGRVDAFAAWTGAEVLVIGGTDQPCSDGFDCPAGRPLTDAAAYDPVKNSWRTITAPREPIGPGVVVDGVLHARTASDGLVSYRPAQDAWVARSVPDTAWPERWSPMVAAGREVLLVAAGRDDGAVVSLLAWDPAADTVRRLPPPPLPAMFEVQVFSADGRVVVTGAELVANPGAAGPSLLIGAIYREGAGWQRLPASEVLVGGHPWVVVDGLLVGPDGSRADGGQVGNWGRSYPYGGMLDLSTLAWQPLPDRPTVPARRPLTGLALGSRVLTSDGLVFDPRAGTWSAVSQPTFDLLARSGASIVWTGQALLVWGGVTWNGEHSTLHADGVSLVPSG